MCRTTPTIEGDAGWDKGIAFAIGSATYFNDNDYRRGLLETAEIAGHTTKWGDKRHYLLGNIALVGEAITLAMRTHYNSNKEGGNFK